MNLASPQDSYSTIERLDADHAAAIAADVQRFIPALQSWPTRRFDVRRKALSCYQDYALVRIADPDSSDRFLLGLHAPGDFWPLDRVGIDTVNRVSPLHLALETVNDYADLFLGWPHAEGLTSHASAQPDGDGFLVQRSDGRQLTVGASGQVNHSIGSPRVPRVEAILGVRKWTLVDATSEEMHGVLADLKWNVAEHDEVELVVRRAAISFYREHALYEVLSRRKATMAFQQYYFLHHPGGIVRPLDGKSQPIHETNNDERPTFAGDEDAADYLRFFCWATRADEGRFLIVERFRDIPWEKAIDKNDRQKVLRNLKPVSVAPAAANAGKGTTWSGSASVSYGRALFVALFSISPNGRVDMTDDTPVVGELPVREFQPGKLTIERTLTGHGEPETYLDTYPTASQQPNGSLVECRPEQFLKQIEARHADPSR